MEYDCEDAILNVQGEECVLNEAEQALSDEFMEEVRAGARPDPEEYLARLPESEPRLRPILEGALMFEDEVARFKREHPNTSIFEWLCRRKGEQ